MKEAKKKFPILICRASTAYNASMSKSDVKNLIREIADEDESFGNMVFEIGVSALAKEHQKKKKA